MTRCLLFFLEYLGSSSNVSPTGGFCVILMCTFMIFFGTAFLASILLLGFLVYFFPSLDHGHCIIQLSLSLSFSFFPSKKEDLTWRWGKRLFRDQTSYRKKVDGCERHRAISFQSYRTSLRACATCTLLHVYINASSCPVASLPARICTRYPAQQAKPRRVLSSRKQQTAGGCGVLPRPYVCLSCHAMT